ncbi:unnamed protein product [Zymoseptoria tritici ST99CH_1E4]|uniref:Integrase catalytic domain-containing protein n=1 Tax=Zymoseptoria tritici ST99CH_1E4 TaxID=1276532 RepID=A0A2H1GI49_ZYMTR|nr:unnamed protein product [Zymoseptoria tritici ST99CH_1E4]
MAHYIPVRKDINAETLAEVFLREIFRLHGTPKSITSDRGPILTSKFWSTLCYHLRVRRGLSTAYHPQTDSQTERQNQTLEQYLRVYYNYEQDDWAQMLSVAEFSYNDSVHATTGVTPFQACNVRDPIAARWPDLPQLEGKAPSAAEMAHRVIGLQKTLHKRLAASQERHARYYNARKTAKTYKVGDCVYLSTRYLKSIRPSEKLDHKYVGPYRIQRVVNDVAYTLELPETMNIHPTFHISLLEEEKPAKITERAQNGPKEIRLEEPDVYVVDKILKREKQHGR